MNTLDNQKMIDANAVFDRHFLNSKSLYLYCFNQLPNVHFINGIEGEKAYEAFKETFADLIVAEYKYRRYQKKKKCFQFDETFFILKNNCIV
jgi:hypothetical protein